MGTIRRDALRTGGRLASVPRLSGKRVMAETDNKTPPGVKSSEAADLGSNVEQEIYAQRLEKAAQVARARASTRTATATSPSTSRRRSSARTTTQSAEDLEKAPPVAYDVAGRMVAMRSFGKAAFIKLRDRSGEIQVHVKKDALGDAYELFKLVDLGDFVAAPGHAVPLQDRAS